MAGDLIPPPSPAGKPEADWDKPREPTKGPFAESSLLHPDAGREVVEPRAQDAGPSAYRSRFGFILGALVGVGIAALVVIGLVVASDDPIRAPAWSTWKPDSKVNDIRAIQIAQHVGHEYRLDDGDQLVDVYAQKLEVDGTPLNVVIRSTGEGEGADIIDIPGNSLLFVLKGLGPRGSIDSGEPSPKRLRLVQREAYELALYAFKYVKGIDNVVAFLPPAPPSAADKAADTIDGAQTPVAPGAQTLKGAGAVISATKDQPVPAMLFLPGDVEASLKRPLTATFPSPDPPRPSTLTDAEESTFAAFAQVHGFSASVVPDQTGAGFLVLDRLSSSAAAQEALKAALKA